MLDIAGGGADQGTRAITVRQVLDDQPLGSFRALIVLIGFLIFGFDGADVLSAGLIYPTLIAQWKVSDLMISTVVTSGLISMAAGAFLAGPLADRLGRKLFVLVSVLVATVGTYLTAASHTIELFMAARILSMAGLGGAMPITLALVSEILPERRRSFLVATTFSGYAAGTAVAGYLAAVIIPTMGWHILLIVLALGGTFLAIAVALLFPESPQQLLRRTSGSQKMKIWLNRMAPKVDVESIEIVSDDQVGNIAAKSEGISLVLSRHYLITSVSLWTCYFVGICVIYLFQTYFPILVSRSGYSGAQISGFVAANSLAGLAGAIAMGYAMDKIDRFIVPIAGWILVAACFVYTAFAEINFTSFLLLNVAFGFFLQGVNTCLNALASTSYPPAARGTGVSWMHSFGRLGAILTGVMGGVLLSLNWSMGGWFLTMTLPLAVGVLGLIVLRLVSLSREQRTTAASRFAEKAI